jgi:hypothetical protein
VNLALLLALALPAAPPVDEWELLGTRRVSFAADRDVVEVGAREGVFNALKIEVVDGDLEMFNVRVTFGDGSTWSPDTRLTFVQGSRSRTIDLPGAARVVRRVEFFYRSRLRRGRATIHIFGRIAGTGGRR